MTNKTALPTGRCPRCEARWTWTGNTWLIADVHGRASFSPQPVALAEDGEPAPLPQCPLCQMALVRGKAKVEEALG